MYGPGLLTVCNVLIVFVFFAVMLYVWAYFTHCNVLIVFVFLCRDALCMVLVYSLFAMF